MIEIVYDIETRTWASEHPGGWDDIENFGLALAITWCECCSFQDFTDAGQLYDHLIAHDRVVTFNGLRFDNTIVAADAGRPRRPLDTCTFDILADLTSRLGHRVSLDQLAEGTFYRRKSADGEKAVAWWNAYEALRGAEPDEAHKYLQKLKHYCLEDVELTRDIYHHGLKHGHVWYMYHGTRWQVEVDWRPDAPPPALTTPVADPKGGEDIVI